MRIALVSVLNGAAVLAGVFLGSSQTLLSYQSQGEKPGEGCELGCGAGASAGVPDL